MKHSRLHRVHGISNTWLHGFFIQNYPVMGVTWIRKLMHDDLNVMLSYATVWSRSCSQVRSIRTLKEIESNLSILMQQDCDFYITVSSIGSCAPKGTPCIPLQFCYNYVNLGFECDCNKWYVRVLCDFDWSRRHVNQFWFHFGSTRSKRHLQFT